MIRVTCFNRNIKGEVEIPPSKSESNRALLVLALNNFNGEIINLSQSDDTLTLQRLLKSNDEILNAGAGGTTFRFLGAYCALKGVNKIITAGARMKQRPVAPLVDSLNALGADISYPEQLNFPPIKINNKNLKGNFVRIDASISSQFISALLLIAPYLPEGLTIEMQGEEVSKPYVSMTLSMMKYFGVNSKIEGNSISIAKGNYNKIDFKVNGDWSAAAYFYEIAALSDSAEIKLNGIHQSLLQGDYIIADVMKYFGVKTEFFSDHVVITKESNFKINTSDIYNFDFINYPDIALSVAATCAGLGLPADIRGLKNLHLKESDRVASFQREIYKLNILTDFCDRSKLKIYNSKPVRHSKSMLKTYEDHRQAMLLAPLAIKTGEINIDQPHVVTKSFPDFWQQLKRLGLEVQEVV